MKLHPLIDNAYKVLAGEELSRDEALTLALAITGEDIMDLLALANKVRKKYAGAIEDCSILNVKSGRCSQNCRFCAQSGHYDTGVDCYELLSPEQVLAAARKVYDAGIRRFGYVSSGCGYTVVDDEFRQILATLDRLHEEFPDMQLCVSIGILSEETARLLAEHHVYRYNMNLQTSPARYAELIADTHSIADKIATIRALQKVGVTNCTGGIFGLGESWADRVDMAFAIKDLDVEGIPLNVLLPIKGTPLADRPLMAPVEVAKAFALFRLVNPSKMIKFAAGRETTMKDFQGLLMLAGANGMISGGYLTTRGRSIDDDMAFIRQLNEF
ncbi:MAG: biotin synthase BioB [Lentisphaerae bacterium]|nr:biotin synthase BioB [Lentisphaerota bacterium]